MPFIQRNDAGQIVGQFANQQPGYAEEWIADDNPELLHISPAQLAADERGWRDRGIDSTQWLVARHREQQEMNNTTLTGQQYTELLQYRQALRDWPQTTTFPAADFRPVAPSWIAEQIQ